MIIGSYPDRNFPLWLCWLHTRAPQASGRRVWRGQSSRDWSRWPRHPCSTSILTPLTCSSLTLDVMSHWYISNLYRYTSMHSMQYLFEYEGFLAPPRNLRKERVVRRRDGWEWHQQRPSYSHCWSRCCCCLRSTTYLLLQPPRKFLLQQVQQNCD